MSGAVVAGPSAAEVEKNRRRSLISAAANEGNVTQLQELLPAGADVDAPEEFGLALYAASYRGHVSAVQMLLNVSSQPTAAVNLRNDGFTALGAASQQNHTDILHLLLRYNASVNAMNANGHPALWSAAKFGNMECARVLLAAGADVNATSDINNGHQPLHAAAFFNHVAMAELLLDNGASVSSLAANESVPLHLAAAEGSLAVAELLLRRGADAGAVRVDGIAALHLAAQHGFVELVSLLLDHGAALDPLGSKGETPLHTAAYVGQLDVVRLLLERGANAQAMAKNWETPRTIALRKGHDDVAALLAEREADVTSKLRVYVLGSLALICAFLLWMLGNRQRRRRAATRRVRGLPAQAAVPIMQALALRLREWLLNMRQLWQQRWLLPYVLAAGMLSLASKLLSAMLSLPARSAHALRAVALRPRRAHLPPHPQSPPASQPQTPAAGLRRRRRQQRVAQSGDDASAASSTEDAACAARAKTCPVDPAAAEDADAALHLQAKEAVQAAAAAQAAQAAAAEEAAARKRAQEEAAAAEAQASAAEAAAAAAAEDAAAAAQRQELETAAAAEAAAEEANTLVQAEQQPAPAAVEAPPTPAQLKECCVCLADVPSAALLVVVPCGHRCVCDECWRKLQRPAEPAAQRCPICSAPAAMAMRVFEA